MLRLARTSSRSSPHRLERALVPVVQIALPGSRSRPSVGTSPTAPPPHRRPGDTRPRAPPRSRPRRPRPCDRGSPPHARRMLHAFGTSIHNSLHGATTSIRRRGTDLSMISIALPCAIGFAPCVPPPWTGHRGPESDRFDTAHRTFQAEVPPRQKVPSTCAMRI